MLVRWRCLGSLVAAVSLIGIALFPVFTFSGRDRLCDTLNYQDRTFDAYVWGIRHSHATAPFDHYYWISIVGLVTAVAAQVVLPFVGTKHCRYTWLPQAAHTGTAVCIVGTQVYSSVVFEADAIVALGAGALLVVLAIGAQWVERVLADRILVLSESAEATKCRKDVFALFEVLAAGVSIMERRLASRKKQCSLPMQATWFGLDMGSVNSWKLSTMRHFISLSTFLALGALCSSSIVSVQASPEDLRSYLMMGVYDHLYGISWNLQFSASMTIAYRVAMTGQFVIAIVNTKHCRFTWLSAVTNLAICVCIVSCAFCYYYYNGGNDIVEFRFGTQWLIVLVGLKCYEAVLARRCGDCTTRRVSISHGRPFNRLKYANRALMVVTFVALAHGIMVPSRQLGFIIWLPLVCALILFGDPTSHLDDRSEFFLRYNMFKCEILDNCWNPLVSLYHRSFMVPYHNFFGGVVMALSIIILSERVLSTVRIQAYGCSWFTVIRRVSTWICLGVTVVYCIEKSSGLLWHLVALDPGVYWALLLVWLGLVEALLANHASGNSVWPQILNPKETE